MPRGSSQGSQPPPEDDSEDMASTSTAAAGNGSSRLLPSMPSSWPSLRRRRAGARGSRLHWITDEKVDACMVCAAPFTVTFRKHHCRRCGHVICSKCSHFVDATLVFNSPETTTDAATAAATASALTVVATAPAALLPKDTTRVCGPCGAALTKVVHDPAAQAKAAVDGSILRTPAYVYALYDKKEELAIGSLSVVVVQARGLPAADRNGLSDPYAKLTLTGVTITGGQEWPESMQTAKRTATRFSTLNPIWKEHFVLRVPRAEAVLRIEVKDYDFPALNDDALGQTAIPLDDLAHQRRVDRWFPLMGEDGEEKGEIRLLLQFRFNRWGEALSRFWSEPPYVPDWPGFAPNRAFQHVKDLMQESQLYIGLLQGVGAVLAWARPLVTLLWLALVLALTWFPRYMYSGVQLLLASHILYNYVRRRGRAQTLELDQATAGRRRTTIRELVKQRRLRAVLRGGMSDADTVDEQQQQQHQQQDVVDRGSTSVSSGGAAGDHGNGAGADGAAVDKKASAEEEKRKQQQQQEEEQESVQSLGFLLNILGKRLGRSEATTNLQNGLGLLVKLLRGVRHLLEWEYPAATLAFLLALLGSAAAHCFLSTAYLFIVAELAVFGLLTWPLSTLVWYTVRCLRLARSLGMQLAWGLKRGDVEGQMSDAAFAQEVQGGMTTAATATGETGFGEAKTGE